MSGLSKTGAVLIAVFAICIIAFAAQVVYVLWCSTLCLSNNYIPAVAAEPPIDDVALKLPLPSRGLFTIAEEREGSAADGTTDSFEWAVEIEGNKIATHEDQIEAVESCGDSDHYEDEATPFSTPCDSPPYYTPSPSPVRDDVTATSI
ncbi:PREDICTED: uncharacterized protein LOC104824551 [Tarenaya hassleriana]|uniref:uncharacterized protein LOC104824551 n=1 Tax=Tarenaya hassleriana TaxID=28532 RepID=UPI00053C236F|nr:PREDICTED: uncharacterized protein LOC104824551 [Tarenaya hassleriana]